MLKRYSHALLALIVACDLAVTTGSWFLAYFIRFVLEIPPLRRGVQPLGPYVMWLPVVLLIAVLSYRTSHLYVPRRDGRFMREVFGIVRASALLLLFLTAFMFLTRPVPSQPARLWARGVAVVFVITNAVLLTSVRAVIRAVLHRLRRLGWNLRHILIVGAGLQGQTVLERIRRNPWTGLDVRGFVGLAREDVGRVVKGVEVLGTVGDLSELVGRHEVDQVFVALPFSEQNRLVDVLDAVNTVFVHVRVFPDLRSFVTLNPTVEEFDGLPVLGLHESPLAGWASVGKRAMDIAISALALIVVGPPMLALGLVHKIGSPGPILYRQRRVGLDGVEFGILKLRSMRVDAEAGTGPVWARPHDERCTKLGALMRRWNLDELPQFLNVLRGDMSLVGPRPERPELIREFRKRIPKYMLRHKMRAGMTGWAQVNGWRGDTSLDKRIQYDLHYIENWSFLLDVWILVLTPFARRNAY